MSDIHGKKSALQELLEGTGKQGIEAVVAAGDLTSHGTKEEALELIEMLSFTECFCVPGNLDSSLALNAMEEKGCSIHSKKREFKGIVFAGMGGGLAGGAGETVYSEEEIAQTLGKIAEPSCALVTHLPPKNSALDTAMGRHIGSVSVRAAVEAIKPAFLFCGHAHDSRGIERIGETLCVNPGPASLGCAAVVDTGKREAELL